jgi:hypothetical protein
MGCPFHSKGLRFEAGILFCIVSEHGLEAGVEEVCEVFLRGFIARAEVIYGVVVFARPVGVVWGFCCEGRADGFVPAFYERVIFVEVQVSDVAEFEVAAP